MLVAELYREHGMSSATVCKWRAKYGGMDASLISEMKAKAEENRRLKRVYRRIGVLLERKGMIMNHESFSASTGGGPCGDTAERTRFGGPHRP